jgi:hypothetical protein
MDAQIKRHYNAKIDENFGLGLMDLNSFIMLKDCECMNEADDQPMANALTNANGSLASDCDEQLILSVAFNQAVKIYSIKLEAPEQHGPKTVKLFINQPRTLDFDMAESYQSVQDLELQPKDLDGTSVNLRYVKFQNVQNITIFVKDNQSGDEKTVIDSISFIGLPLAASNMDNLLRGIKRKLP